MIEEMNAWVGCLYCYNNGKLVGEWFNALECDAIALEDIHPEGMDCTYCEELWVFDHEGMDIDGECSPMTVYKYALEVEEIRETVGDLYPVYIEYHKETGAAPQQFINNYYGCYTSEDEFTENIIRETYNIPEELEAYIDWKKWNQDIMYDFTIIETAWNEVHIIAA